MFDPVYASFTQPLARRDATKAQTVPSDMASSADSAERIDLRLSGYVLMNGPFSDEIEERLAILVRVADLLGIDDVSFSRSMHVFLIL